MNWLRGLVLLIFLAHSQCTQHPGIRDAGRQNATVLHDSDFVAVLPSFQARLIVPYGTRSWRGSIRTIIGLNDTRVVDFLNQATAEAEQQAGKRYPFSERYVYFPDDDPTRKMWLMGDPRGAFMPAFAHLMYEEEGYKWILYGDDDTFFFMHHVKQLLAHYDHNQPLIIADNFFLDTLNGPARCLPCHLDTAANEERMMNSTWVKQGGLRPGFACPYCTNNQSCLYKNSERNNASCATSHVYGGFGAIVSVGMMRLLNISEFEKCCKTDPGIGSDQKFSNCISRLTQIGITDPGSSALSEFNANRRLFGPKDAEWYIGCFNKAADNNTKPQDLEPDCKFALKTVVSAHVSAKDHGWNGSAAVMYELELAFRRAIQFQGMKHEFERNRIEAAAAAAFAAT